MAGAVVVQGLRELSRRSPGYEAAGVLTAQVRLPESSYKASEARAAVVERMLARVRALPGVTAAGTTQNAFVPGFSYQTLVGVKDRPAPDGQPHTVQFRRVSTDYFKAMRIRVLQGRTFGEGDVAGQPAVAIVSRRFAERLLPGDPIGQVLVRSNNNTPTELTVVGGHVGFPWMDEVFSLARKYPNFYVDTSAYTVKRLPPSLVEFDA